MRIRRCGVLVTAMAMAVATHADSIAEESKSSEVVRLEGKVERLEAQVRELLAASGDDWLTEQREDEIRGIVQDVLADADTRASLLQSGMTAGYDNGFFIGSADGEFLLKLAGQIQVRYLLNNRDEYLDEVDGWEGGFSLRRVKVNFSGHIGSPRLGYVVQLAAQRNSGTVELEDAIISYKVNDSLKIWGGRFQDTFSREAMMSSKRSQTVDRSAVANIFAANDDYTEGVGLEWLASPDHLKVYGTFNDGRNSGTPGGAGTGFQNTGNDFQNDSVDWAVTGRLDWKVMGDWKAASDVSSWSDSPGPHFFIGGGVHYEVGETGDRQASATTPQTGGYDGFFEWTADALFKADGLGVMGSFYGWHFDAVDGNPLGDTDHYGATIQLGYMIVPDKFEPFVRYEWIDPDSSLSTNDIEILTAGFNWFFKKHNAKLTADVVWAMDNINGTSTLGTGLSGIGLLSDATGQDDQAVGRIQFQLLF